MHSQADIVERAQELFDLLEVSGRHKAYVTFLKDTSAAMTAYTFVTTASCSCQNPFSILFIAGSTSVRIVGESNIEEVRSRLQ